MIKVYMIRTQQNLESLTIPSVFLVLSSLLPQDDKLPMALRLPATHPGQALVHLLPVTTSPVTRKGHEIVLREGRAGHEAKCLYREGSHMLQQASWRGCYPAEVVVEAGWAAAAWLHVFSCTGRSVLAVPLQHEVALVPY